MQFRSCGGQDPFHRRVDMRHVDNGIVEVVIGDEVIECDTVAGTVTRRAVLGGALTGALVLALPSAAAAASAEVPPAAPEPLLPTSSPMVGQLVNDDDPTERSFIVKWYESYSPDTGPVAFGVVATGPGVNVSRTNVSGTTGYVLAPGWESGETVTFTITASTGKQMILSLTAS